MPGTWVRDADQTALHDAVDATATVTGTAVQVNFPGLVRFEQTTGAITGTSVTIDTEIQTSDASDGTFVTIAKFDTLTESDDSETHWVEGYVADKFVRAVSTFGGTSPDVTDLTVHMREANFHREDGQTA